MTVLSPCDTALPLSPGLLDLYAAAELLQHELARVMVDDENAVLLIRPLVALEDGHGRRGALRGRTVSAEQTEITHRSLVSAALTGMCGSVMVTSSPFPTCSSPSQDVSMDAGLKSSEDESTGSETLEFVFKNYYKNITIHAYYFCW